MPSSSRTEGFLFKSLQSITASARNSAAAAAGRLHGASWSSPQTSVYTPRALVQTLYTYSQVYLDALPPGARQRTGAAAAHGLTSSAITQVVMDNIAAVADSPSAFSTGVSAVGSVMAMAPQSSALMALTLQVGQLQRNNSLHHVLRRGGNSSSNESATMTAATASDLEKATMNVAATLLRLGRRFHWDFIPCLGALPSVRTEEQGGGELDELRGLPALLPAATGVQSFLWAPAVQTVTGDVVALADRTGNPHSTTPSGLLTPSSNTAAAVSTLAASSVYAFRRPHTGKLRSDNTRSAHDIVHPGVAASSSSSSFFQSPQLSVSEESLGNTSALGGGVLHSSTLESYSTLMHTVRAQGLVRCSASSGAGGFTGMEEEARQLRRLVIYCSDQADPLLIRAARLAGICHIRVFQTIMTPITKNYCLHAPEVTKAVAEDVAKGLFPCMIVGVFGSALSGAVDPLVALASFCHKTGIWFHIDAAHGGLALLARGGAEDSVAARSGGGQEEKSECAFQRDDDSATQAEWRLQRGEFDAAALHADSVVVSATESFMPFALLPAPMCSTGTGDSLLFVANITKVAWAVTHLDGNEQSSGARNRWRTPYPQDVDYLHLLPPYQRGNRLLHLSMGLLALQDGTLQEGVRSSHSSRASRTPTLSVAEAVMRHQRLMHRVHEVIMADGRFDAPLRSAQFGVVLFRFLTLPDEAVEALAHHWCQTLDARLETAAIKEEAGKEAYSTSGLPRVYVGLTTLQKRTWLSVSLSRCEAFDENDMEALALEFVKETLTEAADMIQARM